MDTIYIKCLYISLLIYNNYKSYGENLTKLGKSLTFIIILC